MTAPRKAAHVPLASFVRPRTGTAPWWETYLSPELQAEIAAERRSPNPPGATVIAKWLRSIGVENATAGKVHSYLETLK